MSRLKDAEEEYGPAPVPDTDDLDVVRNAAAKCRACPLWKRGTQTVFGEGTTRARILFVGEQPGDREDLAGKPFIGPAGRVLDQALDALGIERSRTYVTNAVKHFKFEMKGKKRMHDSPNPFEIEACKPWLEAELEIIKPRLVVALGASAARSLFGRTTKILQNRGSILDTPSGWKVLVTVHPSSLLRLRATGDYEAEFAKFVHDLSRCKEFV